MRFKMLTRMARLKVEGPARRTRIREYNLNKIYTPSLAMLVYRKCDRIILYLRRLSYYRYLVTTNNIYNIANMCRIY